MKMNSLLIGALLALVFTASSCSSSRTSAQREQERIVIRDQIESGRYKIEATTAYPQRGRSVPLTSPYSVEIRNDSVFSHLPFYGRAFAVPYGGGQGLIFEAPLSDYEYDFDGEGNARVTFSATSREDTYDFTMDVYTNGSTNITITMRNRESMRYLGRLSR